MKTRVIFKNVAQGDTIIVETELDDRYIIGIVDCKRYEKRNVVIEYLESIEKIKSYEIAFILISHPHADHYSGIISLLDYLEKHKKIVGRIYKTFWFLRAGERITAQNKSSYLPKVVKKALDRLIKKIEKGHLETKLIENCYELHNDDARAIGKMGINLKPFAPADQENDEFEAAILACLKNEKKLRASTYANLFSTVLSIYPVGSPGSFALLTSDAEVSTFRRLTNLELPKTTFQEDHRDMLVGQIPHHGSVKNFDPEFWKQMHMISSNKKVVILKTELAKIETFLKKRGEDGPDYSSILEEMNWFLDDLQSNTTNVKSSTQGVRVRIKKLLQNHKPGNEILNGLSANDKSEILAAEG